MKRISDILCLKAYNHQLLNEKNFILIKKGRNKLSAACFFIEL